MRRAIVALAALLLVAACIPFTAFADTTSVDDYKQTEAYTFMSELCAFDSRNGTENEKAVAAFLKGKLDAVIGERGSVSLSDVRVDESYSTQNVIARIDGTLSDKQIIICAHYDSISGGKNVGASDNASGVTAMYLIAKSLVAAERLPFDVVLIAFGGEESGLIGSQRYVDNMSQAEKDSTLVVFNIDSIANGDDLYFACENKQTSLAKLIVSCGDAVGTSCTLYEKPYNAISIGVDMYGYGYYEAVQSSDHTPFRLEGIPVALFFSGSYESGYYAENADASKSIMNTTSDTLARLEANVGGAFVDRIQTVTSVVTATVTSSDFADVAVATRDELQNIDLLFNSLYPTIGVVAILIVVAIFAARYYRKLQKRAIMGTAEVKSTRVFSQPNADDIFSYGSNNDADDIFKL